MNTENQQYCTFYLDEQCYGVDVLRIQEVICEQPVTKVPLAHSVVSGIINLRGQIVTALDLRKRLELPPAPSGSPQVNVVLQTDDGAVSLLVDKIGDILEVSQSQYQTPPETLQGSVRGVIRGVYKLPDELLVVLDPQLIVVLPESPS